MSDTMVGHRELLLRPCWSLLGEEAASGFGNIGLLTTLLMEGLENLSGYH